MALSVPEQRKLAEIEKHLSAEDPRLARVIRDWSAGPSWRSVAELTAGVVMSVAASLAGVVLIDGQAGIVLIALGTLGLLAAIVAGVRMLLPGWRRTAKRDAWTRAGARTRPGTDQWYLWIPWWYPPV